MTNECGIRISFLDSLAPWQGNPGGSPRARAHDSWADTQTTIWPSTKLRQPPGRSRSATTSRSSWLQRTGLMSRRTSKRTRISQRFSRREADDSLKTERAPRGRGKRGRLAHHPNEEGRSVLAHAIVPVRRRLWTEETRGQGLPFRDSSSYRVITRDDTYTHGGRGGSTGSDIGENASSAHQRRRGHRGVRVVERDPQRGPDRYNRQDPGSPRASQRGSAASRTSHQKGSRAGRGGRSATTSRLAIAEGLHPNLGGSVEPLTQTKASCGCWASRRFTTAQKLLCLHREGTANERIRARLG